MTFTYDITTSVGHIRLLTGDNASPGVFSDEEISLFVATAGSVNLAAATLLESWAAKYGANADSERMGDYSYTQSVVDRMLKMAERLRKSEAETPAFDWAEMDLAGTLEKNE